MNQQDYNQELTRLEILAEETKSQALLQSRHQDYLAQLRELKEKYGAFFSDPPLPPPSVSVTIFQSPSLDFLKEFKQEILTLLEAIPAKWFFVLIVFSVVVVLVSFTFLITHFF